MERRCQEVINRCSSQENSLIEFIHDVGAGGLSNTIPELAKDSDLGVFIELSKILMLINQCRQWKFGQMSLKKDTFYQFIKIIETFEKICKEKM